MTIVEQWLAGRPVASNEAGLIVTELPDSEGNVSVDVFDVRDGLVVHEWSSYSGIDLDEGSVAILVQGTHDCWSLV